MTPDLKDILLARYEEGGRGPDAYDCFGLFAEVYRRLGRAVPPQFTPENWSDRQALIEAESARGWVRLEKPEPWSAVTFRLGRFVCHLGVVLPDCLYFLHAEERINVTCSRLDSPMWAERIAGFYRHV